MKTILYEIQITFNKIKTFFKKFYHLKIKLNIDKLRKSKNEFNKSLDFDGEAFSLMNEEQKEEYQYILIKRRNEAHNNDFLM